MIADEVMALVGLGWLVTGTGYGCGYGLRNVFNGFVLVVDLVLVKERK